MEHPRTTGAARADDHVTTRADLLRVAGAGVLWGTGGLAGALLADRTGLAPIAVAAYRLAAGGLLLVALITATGALRRLAVGPLRGGAAWRRLTAIGLLAALYQSCYFAAVALTSVSVATLITLGTAPVLVVLADAARSRRAPGCTLLAALGVAIAGLVLLVGSPAAGGDPAALAAGTVLALGSAAGFAAITLIGRRPLSGLDPVATTALGFTLGGVVLLAVAAVADPAGLAFPVDAAAFLLVGYLGVVPTALAYVLYFGGLRTVRPGPASLIALLEPLTAAALGAALLGERLGLVGTAGALLVGTAVLLCRRG